MPTSSNTAASAGTEFAKAEKQWAGVRNELLRLITSIEARRKTAQKEQLNELMVSLRSMNWEPESH